MKLSVFFAVYCIARSVQSHLIKRQLGGLLSGSLGTTTPTQSALRIERDLPTNVKRDGFTVKRIRLTYGPYKIKGQNVKGRLGNGLSMDPGGTAFNYMSADIPRDITIITSNSTWTLLNGTEATLDHGLYNHHLLVLDISKSAPTIAKCASGRAVQPPMSMFSGSSEDKGGAFYSTADGQFNSGYYIGKTDKIIMLGDVVNYWNETQEIYHVSDIQYIEGKAKGSMEAVTQLWDVGTCSGRIGGLVHPPAGVKKFSVSGNNMTIVQDGYFLAFRGHLHDGGVSLDAKINGKAICSSAAKYGGTASDPNNPGEGTINEMVYCYPKQPMKVKKGDIMTMEAHYDFEKHPQRKQHGGGMAETMALMSIFFTGPDMK